MKSLALIPITNPSTGEFEYAVTDPKNLKKFLATYGVQDGGYIVKLNNISHELDGELTYFRVVLNNKKIELIKAQPPTLIKIDSSEMVVATEKNFNYIKEDPYNGHHYAYLWAKSKEEAESIVMAELAKMGNKKIHKF